LPASDEPAKEDAYRRQESAHRAYHLNRITSQFRTTISQEGARRLARLLSIDGNVTGKE
jgi:hypothetical protein